MPEGNINTLSDKSMQELRWSYQRLEHPSFSARLSNVLAEPIEEAISLLPKDWQIRSDKTLKANTYRTVRVALFSMRTGGPPASSHPVLHKPAAMGTGAAGGWIGPLALLVDLPLTTTLILRSIAHIARSEGEDLTSEESRIACVPVFALGARTKEDEQADVGYYALRTILGFHFVRDIAEYAANATGPHIPAFVELTRGIAARFGVVISDAAAVRMVPIAGAATARD